MNPDFYAKLPPDLKKLVDDSVKGVEKEIGEGWDGLDVPGKNLIVDGGAEVIRLSAAEDAKFRKIGAQVTEAKLKELDAKGLQASATFALMKSLADKHAKSSKNFWK
jgi:TRAP-type C4-dicarboxylate transport system substrate-binding protein